jgi:hypothetical protein
LDEENREAEENEKGMKTNEQERDQWRVGSGGDECSRWKSGGAAD